MASPQKENGFVCIAHELVEAFCKLDIRGSEFRILWTVVRYTYGYNVKETNISLTFFQKNTGMNRNACARAIKELVSRKILGSIKGDTSNSSKYWIQKDYDKWLPSIKPDTSIKKEHKTSIKGDTTLVSKPHIVIQQTTNKENLQKTTTAPVRILQEFFYSKHEETQGQKCLPAWAKDGKIFKDMLTVFDIEKIKELIVLYYDSKDEFILNAGYSVGVFKSVIPKLQTGKAAQIARVERMINA